MKKSIPEDKLLKLIRGQKIFAPSVEQNPSVNLKEFNLSLYNTIFSIPLFNITVIKRILIFLLFLTSLILLSSFIVPVRKAAGLKTFSKIPPEPLNKTVEPLITPHPYEDYSMGMQGRSIFKYAGGLTNNLQSSNPANEAQGLDAAQDLNLIGIVSGADGRLQAIIEDKKSQKTHYVSQGDSFGSCLVEQILEKKVIITYAGGKFELYF
jgi:hypothetical protein